MVADPLSRVFSALADPTRRDIVARLAVGDATVNELAAPYDVTVQAVSKHLKVLEDAGLVSRSREAQRRPVHFVAGDMEKAFYAGVDFVREVVREKVPAPVEIVVTC